MHSRIKMAEEVLEVFMKYRVEWEEDDIRSSVNVTLMHLAQLDAWIRRVETMMITEVEQSRQR